MKGNSKASTHLSAKGQVVIPKVIRDAEGWRTGLELEVEARADGVLLRPKSLARAQAVEGLLGCTNYSGPKRSLADMEAAIKREAKARR